MKDLDEDLIVDQYLAGCSLNEIARRMHVSKRTISAVLHSREIPFRSGGGRPGGQAARGLRPQHITAEAFTDAWWKQNNAVYVQAVQHAYPRGRYT